MHFVVSTSIFMLLLITFAIFSIIFYESLVALTPHGAKE